MCALFQRANQWAKSTAMNRLQPMTMLHDYKHYALPRILRMKRKWINDLCWKASKVFAHIMNSHRRNVFWCGRFIWWLIIIINLHEIIYTKCAHLFSSLAFLFWLRAIWSGACACLNWVMVKERATLKEWAKWRCHLWRIQIEAYFCTIVNDSHALRRRWHINAIKTRWIGTWIATHQNPSEDVNWQF